MVMGDPQNFVSPDKRILPHNAIIPDAPRALSRCGAMGSTSTSDTSASDCSRGCMDTIRWGEDRVDWLR